MNSSPGRAWWTCVLLAACCTLVAACRREIPAGPQDRSPAAAPQLPRITRARLSGFGTWQPCTASVSPGRVVQESRCGNGNIPADLVSIVAGECNRRMKTRSDAVRLLAWLPQCTDAAVAKLELLAAPRRDALLMSDLAAAYYTRAERKDQPSDLVRSLDAAE